jgi:prepilin-type N-terminal cleavage/methylation domain-containing protein
VEITPPPTHGRVRWPQRTPAWSERRADGWASRPYRPTPSKPRPAAAFTLVEVLVTLTILGVLAVLAAAVVPSVTARADRADALGKMRTMGTAVLQYAPDHGGLMPPLFPGQVLEYEQGRGGRIVTECATYLGLPAEPARYLAVQLMPRAYARLDQPADQNALRVYVMNTAVTNRGSVVNPFGRVTTPGQPPTANTPLAVLAGAEGAWMMSSADQQQPNVAAAPWRANTPRNPPLGKVRAVFRFDGSAGLEAVGGP